MDGVTTYGHATVERDGRTVSVDDDGKPIEATEFHWPADWLRIDAKTFRELDAAEIEALSDENLGYLVRDLEDLRDKTHGAILHRTRPNAEARLTRSLSGLDTALTARADGLIALLASGTETLPVEQLVELSVLVQVRENAKVRAELRKELVAALERFGDWRDDDVAHVRAIRANLERVEAERERRRNIKRLDAVRRTEKAITERLEAAR